MAIRSRDESLSIKETQVRNLIFHYRSFGHLNRRPIRYGNGEITMLILIIRVLDLTDADLDTEFDVGSEIGMGRATLRKIIEKLKAVYLGPIGFEYNFIRNDDIRAWFFQKIEQEYFTYNPTVDEKKES